MREAVLRRRTAGARAVEREVAVRLERTIGVLERDESTCRRTTALCAPLHPVDVFRQLRRRRGELARERRRRPAVRDAEVVEVLSRIVRVRADVRAELSPGRAAWRPAPGGCGTALKRKPRRRREIRAEHRSHGRAPNVWTRLSGQGPCRWTAARCCRRRTAADRSSRCSSGRSSRCEPVSVVVEAHDGLDFVAVVRHGEPGAAARHRCCRSAAGRRFSSRSDSKQRRVDLVADEGRAERAVDAALALRGHDVGEVARRAFSRVGMNVSADVGRTRFVRDLRTGEEEPLVLDQRPAEVPPVCALTRPSSAMSKWPIEH